MTRRGSVEAARTCLPAVLVGAAARPGASRRERSAAAAALVGLWTGVYLRYRRRARAETAREYELLEATTSGAFSLHYNECVPTIEEEFELWGPYHQHRHEMRYDHVAAAVRRHLPPGGRVLDVGCGSALVADRLSDLSAHYTGVDFGDHHIAFAAKKFEGRHGPLRTSFLRGDAEALPFVDRSFDVVVMSEVIEHLLRPERAVWEVGRVLRPGGTYVLTTNNASELPLRSPLSHLFVWVEKALGAYWPGVISRRPWIWPHPVDCDVLPAGSPDVYVPHTHHVQPETRRLLAGAGLQTLHWSTFEFPPPQSATASWLDDRGAPGRRVVDVIEAIATRVPLVNKMGCHLFMLARKDSEPLWPVPPPGIWPGPLSV